MTSFDERMLELRGRFVRRVTDDRARLVIAIQTRDRDEIRNLAHGLSGAAGVFGFQEISDQAQAVEEAVDAAANAKDLYLLCSRLLDCLGRAAYSD